MISSLVAAIVRDLGAMLAQSTVARLEHDPEKWEPVFGKHHAQTKT
jgi:hypothetical protein